MIIMAFDIKSGDMINALSTISIILILVFSWFYLPREMFGTVIFLVILFLLLVEYLKFRKWLKNTVSIQVVIHKNEK